MSLTINEITEADGLTWHQGEALTVSQAQRLVELLEPVTYEEWLRHEREFFDAIGRLYEDKYPDLAERLFGVLNEYLNRRADERDSDEEEEEATK
jgi:hypothetical protein